MNILQATFNPAADRFEAAGNIFETMQTTVDPLIQELFNVVDRVFLYFYIPVTLACVIYIALIGYAFMSGYIVMSGRELAIRLSKIVLALAAMEIFRNSAFDVYSFLWDLPESLGSVLVTAINGLPTSDFMGSPFENLIADHNEFSKELAMVYSEADAGMGTTMMLWIISMAPLAVILLTYAVAKFVSFALFLFAPIVLLLSLTSVNTPYISTWVKALLVTLITVILLYLLGAVTLSLLADAAQALANEYIASGEPITIPMFYIYGVFCLLGVVLIGQCTSIASTIVGSAAINTQQGTSLMQIGALNAANSAKAAV